MVLTTWLRWRQVILQIDSEMVTADNPYTLGGIEVGSYDHYILIRHSSSDMGPSSSRVNNYI